MSDYDADDCYRVDVVPGGFRVRHYPDRETRRACCALTIKSTDADRAKAIPDADTKGEAATLARAYAIVERKHGRRM